MPGFSGAATRATTPEGIPLTSTPAHWHHAITLPLNDEGTAFRTACSPANWPTSDEARQQLVAPILAMPDAFGSLTVLARVFMRRQEPYLCVPGTAIFAIYPCDGNCDTSERAHLDHIMARAVTQGTPFSPAPGWMIPPSCN